MVLLRSNHRSVQETRCALSRGKLRWMRDWQITSHERNIHMRVILVQRGRLNYQPRIRLMLVQPLLTTRTFPGVISYTLIYIWFAVTFFYSLLVHEHDEWCPFPRNNIPNMHSMSTMCKTSKKTVSVCTPCTHGRARLWCDSERNALKYFLWLTIINLILGCVIGMPMCEINKDKLTQENGIFCVQDYCVVTVDDGHN